MSLSVKGFKYRTIGTTNALLCPEPIHPPPSLRVEVRVFSAKMINKLLIISLNQLIHHSHLIYIWRVNKKITPLTHHSSNVFEGFSS